MAHSSVLQPPVAACGIDRYSANKAGAPAQGAIVVTTDVSGYNSPLGLGRPDLFALKYRYRS